MCGCPACVAARGGDTSTFKASGYDPASLHTTSLQLNTDTQSGVDLLMTTSGGALTPAAISAPSYAISALVNPYGYKWGSMTVGASATVTFSFLTSVPGYYASNAGERSNFAAMNTAQQNAALAAFSLYSQVANITFVQVAPGTGSINLGMADLGNGIGGWAYYPYPGYSGSNDASSYGDVWITNRYSSYNNPTPGSWEYQTFIHEIGHAIGMKHPGNYNAGGGGTAGPYLPSGEDNHQYTVMSYYSGPSYGSLEPITPQLYDVATIQYLYGANTSTRSGSDTYTFST
jgi:hypothetical protein